MCNNYKTIITMITIRTKNNYNVITIHAYGIIKKRPDSYYSYGSYHVRGQR